MIVQPLTLTTVHFQGGRGEGPARRRHRPRAEGQWRQDGARRHGGHQDARQRRDHGRHHRSDSYVSLLWREYQA